MKEKKDITSFCFSGGWAAKLGPGGLKETIFEYGKVDENLLVSFTNNDDASVYRLSDNQYLVSTVDVITPIINDPYIFGQVAAANSLSDIFAMGAKVLYALNVCSFPKEMDIDDNGLIISGALSKLNEIGAVLAGGHTINEPSLLFGLSVTGIIEDQQYFANDMAKPNQSIILTKPFGIGVAYAAHKAGLLSKESEQQWIDTMITLNYKASQIAKKYISTMSDVTGFGLFGHGYEIASASNISLEIFYDKIKFLDNVQDYANQGFITGASYSNFDYLKKYIDTQHTDLESLLLCDPQTSGGLILFVDHDKRDALIDELQSNDIDAYYIGESKEAQDKVIYLK